MNNQIQRVSKVIRSLSLCCVFLAGSALPIHAEGDHYKKGDAVMVDLLGDGKEVYKGIVQEVYHNASGTTYSVKWDTGRGFTEGPTGSVPASRLRPRGGASKPVPAPVKPGRGDTPPAKPGNTPPVKPDNNPDGNPPSPGGGDPDGPVPGDATPGVTNSDLDFFFGQWRFTKWGGGTKVERDGDLYKEWLLYVSPGAPLTINADETYEWTDQDKKPFKGKWRKLTPAEDIITGGKNGLMLLKGLGGLDWRVDYRGIKDGKDFIKAKSDLGSFDGERIGASKGEPAWNKVSFAKGDEVVVKVGSGELEYHGVIDKVPAPDFTGTIYYHITWTEDGKSKTGLFQAIKIRRR